jgi:hypothetical protein
MAEDSGYIGRFVTILSPVFLAASVAVANFAQDAIGADLDEASLAAYLIGVTLGVAKIADTWLKNRGVYEAGS